MVGVSLFNVASSTQAGGWSPVAGKSSEAAATAVFQPKQAAGDSVSVSKLGQALKGVAADIFSVMDKKTKQTVEKIVDSGVMSAEDVATALRGVASNQLLDRYAIERPKDAEDKMMLEYSEKVQANMDRFTEELGAARARQGVDVGVRGAGTGRGGHPRLSKNDGGAGKNL
jgi:hypothetical protein